MLLYRMSLKHQPSFRMYCFRVHVGTTSGTGFEAAKAIVSKGGSVYALNRPSERAVASLQALNEACKEGGTATQVDCDLQDFSSVRAAAADVKKHLKGKGLDALLNNAGDLRDQTPESLLSTASSCYTCCQ